MARRYAAEQWSAYTQGQRHPTQVWPPSAGVFGRLARARARLLRLQLGPARGGAQRRVGLVAEHRAGQGHPREAGIHLHARAAPWAHATCARRRNTLAQVRRTCYSGRSDTTGRPRRVLRLMCPPGVAAEHAQLGPGGAPARCCTGAAARRAPWRTAPSLRPPRWAPARTWAPGPPVRTCGGASGTGPQHQHAARQDMHACLGLGRPRRVQALQGPRGPSAARRCGRRAARPPRLGSRSG